MSKNHFAFEGQLSGIDERQSKSGKSYWVATISCEDVDIPVTVFSPPPAVGLHVQAVGKIVSFNGWAKLENCRLTPCGATLKNAPVEAAEQTPSDDPNEFDSELPF